MKNNKVKVTITATDKIGREESITLHLEEETASMLEKAGNRTLPNGEPYSELRECLNDIEERYKYQYGRQLITKSQYYRLRDFDSLIFHKFYHYTLTITINK